MSKTITGNQLLDLIAEGMKDETDLVGTIAIGDELKKIITEVLRTKGINPETIIQNDIQKALRDSFEDFENDRVWLVRFLSELLK